MLYYDQLNIIAKHLHETTLPIPNPPKNTLPIPDPPDSVADNSAVIRSVQLSIMCFPRGGAADSCPSTRNGMYLWRHL
jgi:hypothetical protein